MQTQTRLNDEAGRLAALERLQVLDTAPEAPFENIVSLVRSVLGVPIAAVTLVDGERQWFKARRGLPSAQTDRDISFCAHAINQIDPLVVHDAKADPRFHKNPLVTGDPSIGSYAGIPLILADGYAVGALCAIDVKPRAFTSLELAQLAGLARIVVQELELRDIAERDHLTGALSRRAFCQEVENEIARFGRYRRPSTLLMIDLDHFKSINDRHGHQAGDQALREITALLDAAKRPADSLGRLGGEEFAMLLPETDVIAGLAMANRLRRAIEAHPIAIGSGSEISITASFGVAELTDDLSLPETWLAAADAPLLLAKSRGRNRCFASPAVKQAA